MTLGSLKHDLFAVTPQGRPLLMMTDKIPETGKVAWISGYMSRV